MGKWEGEQAFQAGIATMLSMHENPMELLAALALLRHILPMGVRNFSYRVGSTVVKIERVEE
ncbi:hypothetical protein DRO31_08310 [Candidatus Bathyarchaeota archaeon]|nr:MAG: hypothetical protein DRO31_08310 [Candidatus Bathyarchaeota archaeon]